MKLGVLANVSRPRAEEVYQQLVGLTSAANIELLRCESTPDDTPEENSSIADVIEQSDVFAAMGGDGTMLRAARSLGSTNKPLMGINIGSLGFLTSVSEKELERAIACLADESFNISDRTVIECRLFDGDAECGTYRALNDVVLHNGALARVVNLDLQVDDNEVSTYTCDGMIVSTPTGSTGHSLSAGGPILHPETSALQITTICPHTLSSRPLVLPGQSKISINVQQQTAELYLTIDGQRVHQLDPGHHVEMSRAETGIKLMQLPGYDYFSVLRQKLHWRGKVAPS